MADQTKQTNAPGASNAENHGEKNGAEDEKASRDRSSVKFPYVDLDTAMELPRAIHSSYGLHCDVDQLAAASNHTNVRSGAFIRKIAAAQTFGLVEREGSTVRLTPIGRRAVQSDTEAKGRAEAFLEVELYRKIYEQFKGGTLPADKGIENTMRQLGVAPKQTESARQVFKRSADQAGFTKHGANRLIAPAELTMEGGKGDDHKPPATETDQLRAEVARLRSELQSASSRGGVSLDHLPIAVAGVLTTIPASGEGWSHKAIDSWTEMFSNLLKLTYPDNSGSKEP
jgi:hypothetical protein